MGLRAILLLIAVVLCVLDGFEVDVGKFNLVSFGAAAFAASFLVEGWRR